MENECRILEELEELERGKELSIAQGEIEKYRSLLGKYTLLYKPLKAVNGIMLQRMRVEDVSITLNQGIQIKVYERDVYCHTFSVPIFYCGDIISTEIDFVERVLAYIQQSPWISSIMNRPEPICLGDNLIYLHVDATKGVIEVFPVSVMQISLLDNIQIIGKNGLYVNNVSNLDYLYSLSNEDSQRFLEDLRVAWREVIDVRNEDAVEESYVADDNSCEDCSLQGLGMCGLHSCQMKGD